MSIRDNLKESPKYRDTCNQIIRNILEGKEDTYISKFNIARKYHVGPVLADLIYDKVELDFMPCSGNMPKSQDMVKMLKYMGCFDTKDFFEQGYHYYDYAYRNTKIDFYKHAYNKMEPYIKNSMLVNMPSIRINSDTFIPFTIEGPIEQQIDFLENLDNLKQKNIDDIKIQFKKCYLTLKEDNNSSKYWSLSINDNIMEETKKDVIDNIQCKGEKSVYWLSSIDKSKITKNVIKDVVNKKENSKYWSWVVDTQKVMKDNIKDMIITSLPPDFLGCPIIPENKDFAKEFSDCIREQCDEKTIEVSKEEIANEFGISKENIIKLYGDLDKLLKGEKVNMAEFRINLNGNIDYSTDTDKDCYSFKLVTKKDKNGIEHRGWEMKYVGKDQETTGISKIPDKILGYDVISLDKCFEKAPLDIPELPETVISARSIFEENKTIENIPKLPDSIEDMAHAFYGCENLKNVENIPENADKNTLEFMFAGCTNLNKELLDIIPHSSMVSYVYTRDEDNKGSIYNTNGLYNKENETHLMEDGQFYDMTATVSDQGVLDEKPDKEAGNVIVDDHGILSDNSKEDKEASDNIVENQTKIFKDNVGNDDVGQSDISDDFDMER